MPTIGNRLKSPAAIAFATAVLGFGIVACGGGDEETPAPTTNTTGTTEVAALTTEDLISQGDAICAEVNAALGAIESSVADDSTKQSQITDIYDGLAVRLTELGTPSDGEAPTAVIESIRGLADGTGSSTDLQTAAEDYGFTDCAEAPQETSYPSESGSVGGSVDGGSSESYVPPTTSEPAPVETPPTTTPPSSSGGGVTPPSTGTGGTGGSSGGGTGGSSGGGSSSGGIGPG